MEKSATISEYTSQINVLTWNIAWRKANGRHGREILNRTKSHSPDVACLTESYTSVSLDGFCSIDADPDYGYPMIEGRRKVRILSKFPLSNVDRVGDPMLPTGRFVAATAETPLGPLRLIGVCIPWKMAHVATGRRDRNVWQDHVDYLAGLKRVLDRTEETVILFGDFNQTIPRSYAPRHIFENLETMIDSRFSVATAGTIPEAGKLAIDHIVVSKNLSTQSVYTISNETDASQLLSDHFAVGVKLSRNENSVL